MIAFEVHVKELFLAEGLVAVAAGIRFLPCVGALVHDHMPLLKESRVQEEASEPVTDRAATPATTCVHVADRLSSPKAC